MMRKKTMPILLTGILAALLLCTSAVAWSDGSGGIFIPIPGEVIAEGTCGDNLTWELDEFGTLILSGSGAMTAYTSSDQVPWNNYMESIVKAELPDGLTTIAMSSFSGCSELTEINIPDSVTEIGPAAFMYCSSLSDITFPNGLTTIGERAFQGCTSLTDIHLPGSLTSMGAWAFYQCTSLCRVNIEQGLTAISPRAFSGCTNLVYVSIPSQMKTIGTYAFSGCSNLPSIAISGYVTSIDAYAFERCDELDTVFYFGTRSQWDSILNSDSGLIYYNLFCKEDYVDTMETTISLQEQEDGLLVELEGNGGSVYYTLDGSIPGPNSAVYQEPFLLSEPADYYIRARTIDSATWTYGPLAKEDKSTIPVIVDSGKCGDTLTWTLDEKGVLTISGTGAMATNYFLWWSHHDSITRVVMEEGVTSICAEAFQYCTNLTKVTIPDTVTNIGNSAFLGCTSLPEITVPDSVTSIGTYTFEQCTGLTRAVLSSRMTELPTGLFYSCHNLTSVTLPDGLQTIGETAFANCINLSGATIPASVLTIGEEAFDNCNSLTSVTIPAAVTSIGLCAFADCDNLETIQVETDNDEYCSVDGVLFTKDMTELIQYPAGAPRTAYTVPEGTVVVRDRAFYGSNNLLQVSVSNTVTTFGPYAFCNCQNLVRVELPDGLTSLSETMFYGCNSLADIILPDSLTTIGADAFYSCSALADITLPDSVTTIGSSAFWGCESLTSIVIPDGVTELSNTFYNCESLTNVTLPEGLNTIGRNTFHSCAIREIEIPSSVTSIGSYAFARCNSLREITIPDTVTTIGDSAFQSCKGLLRAELSNSITLIDQYLFENCSSLTAVNIPEAVTSIGYEAFQGCGNLVSLEIPAGVNTVDYNAFADCQNLSNIFYEGDGAAWSEFTGNSGLSDQVQLFSADNYDDTLAVSIQLTEVPGGVVVSMESTGGAIYYTLDGSIPCTASIPYEAPFLLDEAGEYFINARAIDSSASTYGDVCTEYVGLEQSATPEVTEADGMVYLSAPGDIFYTLDLTQVPTTENYRYEAPLRFDQTTVFSARTIQPGYAPSEVVNYTYYKPIGTGIDYPSESYRFGNVRASFGYTGLSYKIPQVRYTEIFGDTMGQLLYSVYGGNWGGSCFGMSTTALMFHNGQLALEDYSDRAETVYDLLAPASKDSALTQLIERYQVSQFLPAVMAERNDASEGGTMVVSGIPGNGMEGAALVDAVRQACSGGEPVVLIVQNNKGGFHAVVPYKTEGNQIYVYDCNLPGEDNVITYSVSDSGVYRFSYGQYSYSIACNRMSTLLEGLENLQTGGAVLSAEEKEMFLLSSSSPDLTILDENGGEVTGHLSFRATEDMYCTNTVFYLEKGDYTITCNTSDEEGWTLSAATQQDYYTLTVADPTAQVELSEKYGHLSLTMTTEDNTNVQVYATNSTGRENELSATANHIEVYACTEKAILIRTATRTEVVSNGDGLLMSPGPDGYEGAAIQKVTNTARDAYVSGTCTLRTDITQLPGTDFVLTVYISGAGDSGTIYAACYDTDGRMTELRELATKAGKTKYVLSIGADSKQVKILLVDDSVSIPLTQNVLLQ